MEPRSRITGLLTDNKLFTCVLLLLQFLLTKTEFRFCAEGTWHQIAGTECKYGVFFSEPLTSPCYHTSSQIGDLVPRIWPTPCDHPFVNVPNKARENGIEAEEYTLAQKYGEFVLYGTEGNLSQHPGWDDLTTLQECSTTCHMKQIAKRDDHESSDSVEDLGRIRPKLNDTVVKQLTDQTLRLGDYLYDQLMEQDPNPGPDLRIVLLFKKTMEVMGRTCQHPFIPNDFLTRVLYGFLFLVTDNGVGEIDDVTVEEYEDIMEALKICSQTPPNFRLEGKACSMVSTVERVVTIGDDGMELTAQFKPSKLTRGERRFPYETYDIVIESAWQAVQVVHGTCFATFRPNANMHHRYTAAMEQLFGKKIMQRWRYPTQLIDPKMWGTWFLSDVDSTYYNTIACVRAAYEGAPFAMKLDRPIDLNRNSDKLSRKKRSSEFSTIDQYWMNYFSTGGIIKHLEDKIQCFQNIEQRDKVFQEYRGRVCPELDFTADIQDFGDYNASTLTSRNRNITDTSGPSPNSPPPPTDPFSPSIPPAGDKIPIPTFIDLDVPTGRPPIPPTNPPIPPPVPPINPPIPPPIPPINPPSPPTGDKIPIPTFVDLDVPTGRPPIPPTGDKLPIPTFVDLDVSTGKPTDTPSPPPRDGDTDVPGTRRKFEKTQSSVNEFPDATYLDISRPGSSVGNGGNDPETTENSNKPSSVDEFPDKTFVDISAPPGSSVGVHGGNDPKTTENSNKPSSVDEFPDKTFVDIGAPPGSSVGVHGGNKPGSSGGVHGGNSPGTTTADDDDDEVFLDMQK